jgi:L-threonylcarbamoyladenylate synthase
MEIYPLSRAGEPKVRASLGRILREDGLLAYPTDTVYGLGGNFFSSGAHERINALKGRRGKPFSVAVSGMSMLEELVAEIPPIFYRIRKDHFPGPLTLLFHPARHIDPVLLHNSSRIGIRIPDYPALLALIEHLGFPLISTSLNVTGEAPLMSGEAVIRRFPRLNAVIDGGRLPASRGSTVVDIASGELEILREGDIPASEILQE